MYKIRRDKRPCMHKTKIPELCWASSRRLAHKAHSSLQAELGQGLRVENGMRAPGVFPGLRMGSSHWNTFCPNIFESDFRNNIYSEIHTFW